MEYQKIQNYKQMKAAKILFVFLVIMIYKDNYSQVLSLYKVKSTVTSSLFDVYLLLHSSGKYYLIALYNFGEPIIDNTNSDIEPIEVWLSWGNYIIQKNELQLKDSNLNYSQKFIFKQNFLIGKKCFEFLSGSILKKVSQKNNKTGNSDEDLYYNGGIMREIDYNCRYNSNDSLFQDAIIKQKKIMSGLNNNLKLNVNARYKTYYTPFFLEFYSNGKYEYKLGPMCILRGSYFTDGAKIVLKNNSIDGQFLLRISNVDNIVSIILPGAAPGTEFKIVWTK